MYNLYINDAPETKDILNPLQIISLDTSLTEKRCMLSEGCSTGLCQWSSGVGLECQNKCIQNSGCVFLSRIWANGI